MEEIFCSDQHRRLGMGGRVLLAVSTLFFQSANFRAVLVQLSLLYEIFPVNCF